MRILGIDPGLQCTGFGVVNVNPQATLLLGQARGACLTALVSNNLAVAEYTALQLKKAVVGHGKADKAQVQDMVKRLLRLPGLPGKDAADALGLCITHAQRFPGAPIPGPTRDGEQAPLHWHHPPTVGMSLTPNDRSPTWAGVGENPACIHLRDVMWSTGAFTDSTARSWSPR